MNDRDIKKEYTYIRNEKVEPHLLFVLKLLFFVVHGKNLSGHKLSRNISETQNIRSEKVSADKTYRDKIDRYYLVDTVKVVFSFGLLAFKFFKR